MSLIDFYKDEYSYRARARFWGAHKHLIEIFNPSPQWKKNEKIQNYVVRVEKKYALRALNYHLRLSRVYNLDYLNEELNGKLTRSRRKLYKLLKHLTELHYMYKFLREQIRNS
jgi:hypothetical protein